MIQKELDLARARAEEKMVKMEVKTAKMAYKTQKLAEKAAWQKEKADEKAIKHHLFELSQHKIQSGYNHSLPFSPQPPFMPGSALLHPINQPQVQMNTKSPLNPSFDFPHLGHQPVTIVLVQLDQLAFLTLNRVQINPLPPLVIRIQVMRDHFPTQTVTAVGDWKAACLTTYFHLQVHSMALSSKGSKDVLWDCVRNVEIVSVGTWCYTTFVVWQVISVFLITYMPNTISCI